VAKTPIVSVHIKLSENARVGRAAPKRNQGAGLRDLLPADWRRGARRAFLESVLRGYGVLRQPGAVLGMVAATNDPSSLGVSFSDTGEDLGVAVSPAMAVGLDLERIRPVDDIALAMSQLGLARHAAKIARLPTASRTKAFLQIWTAFEAYLKLERAAWDSGAQRFAGLLDKWRIGRDGVLSPPHLRGPVPQFIHFEIEGRLIGCVATPKECQISIKHAKLPPETQR
jgi:hypothetical protein